MFNKANVFFKIFTNEDFKKMKVTKMIHEVNPKSGKKRKNVSANSTEPAERYNREF